MLSGILKEDKMRRIFFIIFLFLSIDLLGTGQIPDYLIYKRDTLSLFSNPLEGYFNFWHKRPNKLFDSLGYNSTACWRGYIAHWKLRNDSLFLTKLEGDKSSIDLSVIFKNKVRNGEVFASWVNENINNPHGKLLYYEHMGYNSLYEYERDFVIKKGILKEIVEYNNSMSRKSKYTESFELLKEYIKTNINYANITNEPFQNARVYVQVLHVTEDGKIDSVTVLRGWDQERDKEAVRVVKSIPEWDILYRKGRQIQIPWVLPVIFGNKEEKSTTR